ncbi:DUF167 family protein [uncultured Hoeflea sp.]|uniref:DUF167 family protein n=1 Tax=uncultured Hoeflea sp. TaxID=538666 RepID=UPI002624670E|nr:DUF167 family protein [uncultured Hoeflea sp.]
MRLTPRAASDHVDGLDIDSAGAVRLKARVRAVPEKNKANRALEALIADRLGVAKSFVRVTSGDASRIKTLRIAASAGISANALEELVRER